MAKSLLIINKFIQFQLNVLDQICALCVMFIIMYKNFMNYIMNSIEPGSIYLAKIDQGTTTIHVDPVTTKRFDITKKTRMTINPIRALVERDALQTNKTLISLSIGDPTLNPDLRPCVNINNALIESIHTNKYHGYFPSAGAPMARKAVAKYWSQYKPPNRVPVDIDWEDVILTSGCSHALDMCMTVLCEEGSNILLPRPGFSLYKTLAPVIGVEIRYYDLLPDNEWQIDLEHLESVVDDNTSAILFNNPSNPCGSVYSAQHIREFLAVAEAHNIPVIADEIYEDIVFPGHQFYPCASFEPSVPVLTCGGISKKFLAPGWRLGWILIHDKNANFGYKIRNGINALSQRLVGPNSIAQGALAQILFTTPKQFFENSINHLYANGQLACDGFSRIPGLRPIKPNGAMYLMIAIDMKCFPRFESDVEFAEALAKDEALVCLPGYCFAYPGYVRIVLSVPTKLMVTAIERMREFCGKYYIKC